ncbi:phosphatase PAP2 family protein, partial [Arcobacter sp.]|uniref:phosphatase PAP2 family protein n=1 Tax=Arcobacter sp. TaxID=1872629 RepID=UPI003C70B766
MLEKINTHILYTALCLSFVIVLFAFTPLDIYVQNFFYKFDTHTWLIDKHDPIIKYIFYNGIKKVLMIFSLLVLFTLIVFRKNKLVKMYRNGLIIVLLSSYTVPFVVVSLKDVTNMPCPKNIEYYGGKYPDVNIFQSYPKDFKEKRIRCWPAGHASAGFALMSIFFLFKKRKNQIIALSFALFIAWNMALYKMFIG